MRPVELTTITMGATIWRMINSVDTVIVGGLTFSPQAGISRGDITDGRDSLVVKLPGDHAYPQLYRVMAPCTTASLLIQFLDRDENPDSLRVLYKGWIKSVKFSQDGQTAELYVESIVSALEQNICDDQFCVGCQVPLFGTSCGLDKNDWDYDGVVSLVEGNELTVTGLYNGGSRDHEWALPGMVKFGDEWRQIFAQVDDLLTLSIPFSTDVTGETVTVYAGCDHTITACEDKFSNVVNYRGFPYMPKQNVFITGLQ